MWLVFRDAFSLLTSWWSKDRIRIPRAQGKLFRVLVGDRLIIRDSLLVVRARRNDVLDGAPQIMLTLSATVSVSEAEVDAESSDGDLWYLTYTNRCTKSLSDLANWHLADWDLANLQTEIGYSERIVVRHGAETFDLFPDEVNVLRAADNSVRSNSVCNHSVR